MMLQPREETILMKQALSRETLTPCGVPRHWAYAEWNIQSAHRIWAEKPVGLEMLETGHNEISLK